MPFKRCDLTFVRKIALQCYSNCGRAWGNGVRIVAMTTLTSFLANRIEGFSIEGLCKHWLCVYIDGSSCEKGLDDVFELVTANVSVNIL